MMCVLRHSGGCGTPDTDSDNDGAFDNCPYLTFPTDACPNDATKWTDGGICEWAAHASVASPPPVCVCGRVGVHACECDCRCV